MKKLNIRSFFLILSGLILILGIYLYELVTSFGEIDEHVLMMFIYFVLPAAIYALPCGYMIFRISQNRLVAQTQTYIAVLLSLCSVLMFCYFVYGIYYEQYKYLVHSFSHLMVACGALYQALQKVEKEPESRYPAPRYTPIPYILPVYMPPNGMPNHGMPYMPPYGIPPHSFAPNAEAAIKPEEPSSPQANEPENSKPAT